MERNQENRIQQRLLFKLLKGKPFWLWDKDRHKQEFRKSQGNCCFNHIVGLPMKKQISMPLFDYEKQICDLLERHKYLWVKKATGLGITELMLRYMAWLCLRDSVLRGSAMCIVTGPRLDLAITLIDRIKGLFPSIVFPTKQTVIWLNGVKIEAFPSHHLDTMRGLANVSFVLLDESDFFPPSQQEDARTVSERYIGKSDNFIVMVSTPNAPGGLFEQIEKEPQEECMYKRLVLPYNVGVGKIYFPEELRKAKNSPSFEREYLCRYAGKVGNAFSMADIDWAVRIGREYDPQKDADPRLPASMGIDPGYGSSKFAFVVTQQREGRIEVVYAEQFARPQFTDMIDNALNLIEELHINKVYIDSANPEVILQLKSALNERVDYREQMTELRSKGADPVAWMKVVPVSFSAEQTQMLGNLKILLEKRVLAINPEFEELVLSLRTATERDGILIKEDSLHNDLLDALRLAVKYYSVGRQRPRIFAKSVGGRRWPRGEYGRQPRSGPGRIGKGLHSRTYYSPSEPGVKTTVFDW
jgi:hypothetical protein